MHADAVAVLVAPSGLWRAWTLDPAVIAALALVALLYGRGLAVLAGKRRRVVRPRQAASFCAGLVLLAAALLSPLDALDATLLSVHMAQHMVLIVVAPMLLMYGRPGLVLMMGLPRTARETLRRAERDLGLRWVVRAARNPLVVLAAGSVALWAWHLPALYDAAVANPTVHAAEHLSFLVTSLAFWRLVIDPGPRRRLGYGAGMVLTFAVMLQSAALGALIALSPAVLYPVYAPGASLWGVSALGDQQLAGALMWIPVGGLYLITIVVLAGRWFGEVDRRMRRREQVAGALPSVREAAS
jgi:putative membrane protein